MDWWKRSDFLLPLVGWGPAGKEGAHVLRSGGDDDKAPRGGWTVALHSGPLTRPLPLGWGRVASLWGSLLAACKLMEGMIRRLLSGLTGRLHRRGGMT